MLFIKNIIVIIASAAIHGIHGINVVLSWLQGRNWQNKQGKTLPVRLLFTDVEGKSIKFASAKATPYLSWLARHRKQANNAAVIRGLKRAFFEPEQQAIVPSDTYLSALIINTSACYSLKKTTTANHLTLDLSDLDIYHTNPDRFFEARFACMEKGQIQSITMKDGTKVNAGDRDWDKAKLHLLSTINLVLPALSHNWVHFHFADIATAISHNMLPIGSVLHQWLSPYTLSHLSTNANGKSGAVMDRDMGEKKFFWSDYFIINHTDNDYFVNSVAAKTSSFYQRQDNCPFDGPLAFAFPPQFSPDFKDVPYMSALKEGFKASQKYVNHCLKALDKQSITLLQEWKYHVVKRTCHAYHPNDVRLEDLLATYIWQVCWVHTLDHQMYYKWIDGLHSASGTLNTFHDAGPLYSHKDQIQFKNMADIAIRYNPNGDSLADLHYKVPFLEEALNTYKTDLLQIIQNHVAIELENQKKNLTLAEIAPSVLM